MAQVFLTLLGGFRAQLASGATVTLPTRKAQALLAYLALPSGRAHPRDKLATLLWGDTPQARARAALRQALFALRRGLPTDPPAVCLEAGTVALDPAVVVTDVATFERHAAAGDPDHSARAVALYQGDLLAGLSVTEAAFEEWLAFERERLRELALETMARLLAHQRSAGSAEAAIRTALGLLALDPLQEPVHRTLMRLYVGLGRRGAALRQYQVCVDALQRELGTAPEAATSSTLRRTGERRSGRAGALAVREAEGVGEELVRAHARLEIVRHADDDKLLHVVLGGEGAEAVADLLGRAGDRALARVLDDGQIAIGVRVALGLLHRRIGTESPRVEPQEEEVAALRLAPGLGLGVRAEREDGHAGPGLRQREGRAEGAAIRPHGLRAPLGADEVRERECRPDLRGVEGAGVARPQEPQLR